MGNPGSGVGGQGSGIGERQVISDQYTGVGGQGFGNPFPDTRHLKPDTLF